MTCSFLKTATTSRTYCFRGNNIYDCIASCGASQQTSGSEFTYSLIVNKPATASVPAHPVCGLTTAAAWLLTHTASAGCRWRRCRRRRPVSSGRWRRWRRRTRGSCGPRTWMRSWRRWTRRRLRRRAAGTSWYGSKSNRAAAALAVPRWGGSASKSLVECTASPRARPASFEHVQRWSADK